MTHATIEEIIQENARLRHACREARLALAAAFGDTSTDEDEGGQPQNCPQRPIINIFKKGK